MSTIASSTVHEACAETMPDARATRFVGNAAPFVEIISTTPKSGTCDRGLGRCVVHQLLLTQAPGTRDVMPAAAAHTLAKHHHDIRIATLPER